MGQFEARGTNGLTRPMNQTRVSRTEVGRARLLSVDGDAERVAHWWLEFFAPASGPQAALAIEGQDWELAPETGGEFDAIVW